LSFGLGSRDISLGISLLPGGVCRTELGTERRGMGSVSTDREETPRHRERDLGKGWGEAENKHLGESMFQHSSFGPSL